MEEFLVVVACLYQRGCTDAASLYYDNRPELQEFVARSERLGRATVGNATVDYLLPAAGLALGNKAVLRLSKTWSSEISLKEQKLIWSHTF